jgi:hypothetical protein
MVARTEVDSLPYLLPQEQYVFEAGDSVEIWGLQAHATPATILKRGTYPERRTYLVRFPNGDGKYVDRCNLRSLAANKRIMHLVAFVGTELDVWQMGTRNVSRLRFECRNSEHRDDDRVVSGVLTLGAELQVRASMCGTDWSLTMPAPDEQRLHAGAPLEGEYRSNSATPLRLDGEDLDWTMYQPTDQTFEDWIDQGYEVENWRALTKPGDIILSSTPTDIESCLFIFRDRHVLPTMWAKLRG